MKLYTKDHEWIVLDGDVSGKLAAANLVEKINERMKAEKVTA